MAHDAPDDRYVTVEIAWCAGCRLDTEVEVVQLPGDPAPVAICLKCAGGVELWWQAVVPSYPMVPGRPVCDARAS